MIKKLVENLKQFLLIKYYVFDSEPFIMVVTQQKIFLYMQLRWINNIATPRCTDYTLLFIFMGLKCTIYWHEDFLASLSIIQ